MKKEHKWWKVPAIVSAVFGFVPLMFAVVSAIYGFWQYVVGGLVMLFFIQLAIWMFTGLVIGIRKLRPKPAGIVPEMCHGPAKTE